MLVSYKLEKKESGGDDEPMMMLLKMMLMAKDKGNTQEINKKDCI